MAYFLMPGRPLSQIRVEPRKAGGVLHYLATDFITTSASWKIESLPGRLNSWFDLGLGETPPT
jgi:hypothetical protein